MVGLPSRAWRLGELDLTRPHGIPVDRSTCPPDDEIQDVAAWLAGRFDTLAATQFELDESAAGTQGGEASSRCTGSNPVPPHPRPFTPAEQWRKRSAAGVVGGAAAPPQPDEGDAP